MDRYGASGTQNMTNSYPNLPVLEGPQCLIASVGDQLQVNQEVLDQIRLLDRKMVVVTITGLYRTGKSYLMNRLAGKNAGFALGSTIQSKTKGIWIWVRPHPEDQGAYLVLMDTEGLGDAEKGDANYDNWIFTLAVLLSSTLVYNHLGLVNDDMITTLSFVSEISKRIKTRYSDESGSDDDFDIHFPVFIMALRDFSLHLIIDGEEVTADQYLEHLLNLRQGKSQQFIESRKCVRKYFKTRKCFTFDRPAGRRKLVCLENLTDEEISDDFLEETEDFKRFVFNECPTMKLPNGTNITGTMFACLVSSYVGAIRNGELPCIENAFITMASEQNRQAVQGAIECYSTGMEEKVAMPTETDEELSQIGSICQRPAIEYFSSHVIMDLNGDFQKQLNEELMQIYEGYEKKNREISRQKCSHVLRVLETGMQKKLKKNEYMNSGGFDEYMRDLDELKERYEISQGLGVQKQQVLDDYINSTTSTSNIILAADEKVTEEEKKIKEMETTTFQLECKRKQDEEAILHLQQLAQEREKALKTTKLEMEKKHAEELAAQRRKQKEMEDKRLMEQERLLQEGFKREAEQTKKEIAEAKQKFIDDQKVQQDMLEQARLHEREMAEVMLREQKMQNQYLLELERNKAELEKQKYQLQYQEQAAQKDKEHYEQLLREQQASLDAVERMRIEQEKADIQRRKEERNAEIERMKLTQEKEEREAERLRKWQKEQQDQYRKQIEDLSNEFKKEIRHQCSLVEEANVYKDKELARLENYRRQKQEYNSRHWLAKPFYSKPVME